MSLRFPDSSRLSQHVSFADDQDYGQMAAIYNHYVKTSADTFDSRTVTEQQWRERLTGVVDPSHHPSGSRQSARQQHFPVLVYSRSGTVVGFAYGYPFRAKAGYDWTAEVATYVAPDHVRQGIGKALLLELSRILAGQGYRSLIAVSALLSSHSTALHRSLGFRAIGTIPSAGYKMGQWHDLGLMQLNLSATHQTRSSSDTVSSPVWPPLSVTALRALPAIVSQEEPTHPDVELFIRTLDDFHDSLYPPSHNYQESSKTLTDSEAIVFVARKGQLAVGMAALKPFYDEDGLPSYGELKRMYVSGLFRQSGVGGSLLAAVEQEAVGLGLKQLKLETGDKQTPAIQLYQKNGFRRCKKFGKYKDHGTNVFMQKPLFSPL